MSKTGSDFEGWVETDRKTKVKEPPLYKVLLHNDDYTSMEFVVLLLEKI
jgi:ATP-dependent Clp protease adaptor protein ClpS